MSETAKYLRIPVEGELEVLEVPKGESAEVIHKAVDGYFECISLDEGLDMWLNEEGKVEGLPWNPRAQALWNGAFGPGTDHIVGPVVLTGGVDDDGETLGLGPALLVGLQGIIGGM